MFRFANPYLLYLLIIIPVLIVLFIVMRSIRRKNLKIYGEWEAIKKLSPDHSSARQIIKFILILLSVFCLIISVSRPQFGSKMKEVNRKGVELIIALDVSNSMLAEDIKPNRLEKAKIAIKRLLKKLRNDKIGLIVFAGDAYVQLPITTDFSAAGLFLSTISTDIVPRQGTAIASAIKMGMKSFSPSNTKNKAIIIITDGETHEGDAINAAKLAVEKNISIHTIGMGSVNGAPIPKKGSGSNDYIKDRDGNVVISKLNANMLKELAQAGNGKAVRASNSMTGLNKLLKHISKMEKEDYKSDSYEQYDDKFYIFAVLAFILLLLEFFMLEKKNKKFKLNIFNK